MTWDLPRTSEPWSQPQEEVMTMMDIDYNGDGMMDVLLAYEDGRISFTKCKSSRSLQDAANCSLLVGSVP